MRRSASRRAYARHACRLVVLLARNAYDCRSDPAKRAHRLVKPRQSVRAAVTGRGPHE